VRLPLIGFLLAAAIIGLVLGLINPIIWAHRTTADPGAARTVQPGAHAGDLPGDSARVTPSQWTPRGPAARRADRP
jgi:hypothetical protein